MGFRARENQVVVIVHSSEGHVAIIARINEFGAFEIGCRRSRSLLRRRSLLLSFDLTNKRKRW